MNARHPIRAAALALCVIGPALAGAQAPMASASSRPGAAVCNAPWADTSVSSDVPGNRVTPKRVLLAVGNPTGLDGGSPAVWTRLDRLFASVVARRVDDRFRIWTCTVTPAELARRRAVLRTFGRQIVLPRGERPNAAFVADRWISWTTTRPGRAGFVVWRQTLAGRRLSRRSFAGRLQELVMTRDGTVAVSTLDCHRHRIWQWTSAKRTTALLPSRRITNPKRPWNETVAIELWDPDSFLLTRPADRVSEARLRPLAPERIRTTSRYRPCRTWPHTTDDSPRPAVRAADPRVVLTTSASWSRRARFDLEGPGTWTRLEACDAASGTRTLAVDAGYVSDDVGSARDTLEHVITVGGMVFADGYSSEGYTGSGSSSAPYDVGYVRRHDAWVAVSWSVASPHAAAWTDAGQVWIVDAGGVRPLVAVPNDFRGLRLRVDGRALDVVARNGTITLPLSPLPPNAEGFPPGGTAFPSGALMRDGSPAAANFGVCSDQHAAYCPDPALTPPTAGR